jgi:non-specific protein-tyrosine kinase
MELDLRQILRIAARWWWLACIAALLAGSSAFVIASRQDPLYSSTVTLRVNPPVGSSADFSALQLTQNLTETYRQMIVMSPVLDLAVSQLSLPYSEDELKDKVTSVAVRDTQLLKLTVSDTDPKQAALIADTIAASFIAYLDQQATDQFLGTQELINQQLADVEETLAGVRAQIEELDTEANRSNQEIQGQIDALQLQETQLVQQQSSLQMQSQSLGLGLAANQAQVSISEPASVADNPYAPRTTFFTILAVLAGVIVAIVAISLLEYLDNTIRADMDIQALTGASLLAAVSELPKIKPGGQQVYAIAQPRSNAAEAIRLLRANLEFAAAISPIKSLAITSVGPGEGKSTVTANLGVVMAQAGFRTVIIDADLRRPTQHKIFNIPNTYGLSTLLTHPETPWIQAATKVAVPNLMLVPSGPIPPNPSDLLSLDRLVGLLGLLREEVDIVLIDTPPVLAVSDPLVVGTKTDGVVLMGRAGHTRRDRLVQATAALRQAQLRVVGIVINQQSTRSGGYYYYGEYDSVVTPTATAAPGDA